MAAKQKSQKSLAFFLNSFKKSLNVFLRETGLHGLKFVGDSTLSIWERSFFLIAFLAAFVMTCQLIANIYAKWNSTPVIIGISPHATSILKVPFPAITICNMNQVQRSKVLQYKKGSSEFDVLKLLCSPESAETEESVDTDPMMWSTSFCNNSLKISDFVTNHSQPCGQMLRYCRFSAVEYDCAQLFRQIITDEGLCCVFNFLPSEFLYKPYSNSGRNLTSRLGHVPVAWDPETGYPDNLPRLYYPTTAVGTGITMGFTAVLDAQLSEYYCSSTNGIGFKILFHNPITMPNVKEEGLVLGVGYETNFRLEVSSSEAMPTIRSISRDDRQCVFKNEKELLYHKIYTHKYCENECIAKFLYKSCNCIPYTYPHIYRNASVCSVRDSICIRRAQRPENRAESSKCRKECLPSCFDISYAADALYFPLAKRDFRIANKQVANMNKSYVLENIAVMNLYYRESAYYGSMKNVYIGFTEFLSNIGGVMGLFMGFSVISIAEVLYFLVLKPISELISWKRSKKLDGIKHNPLEVTETYGFNQNKNIWHTKELYPKGIAAKSRKTTKNLRIKDRLDKRAFL
ncbi:pickpocket protein 28 [Drosophila novamexicana]|uniref:pickpocket protein 28 n=1 Tax=Drosophila novamexicana TaxID=47314 RepID=UPI0011E5AD5F|nr:pickpocket protein 28 [Drosophila novamexicana]